MRKSYSEPVKMPGMPKPMPGLPVAKVDVAPQPAVQTRTRLAWSRSIIDQARESDTFAPQYESIPNVRSTAAARARAGENYRPPQRVQLPLAERQPPAPLAAQPVRKPVAPAVWPDELEQQDAPQGGILSRLWDNLRHRAHSVLEFIARPHQIDDE